MTDKNSGLMVFCELDRYGSVKKICFELISEGLRISSITGDRVSAVIISENTPDISVLEKSGVHEIIIANRFCSGCFSIGTDVRTASEIIKKYSPSIVLFGATDRGRVLAPMVAAVLKCGITADCTGFDIDKNGRLIQIRPALGGNILAHIVSPGSDPQMASVRPAVFRNNTVQGNGECALVTFMEAAALDSRVQLEKIVSLEVKESDKIENAKIIVALGAGIRSKEWIALFDDFAKSIGGALACSRKIVEAGFMSHSRQVGQSGKTISPDVYIAVGISGSPQHLAGMKTASTIIAVNTDRSAGIFSIAHAGFVMDAMEWLKMVRK